MVASAPFQDAAEKQAAALGLPELNRVFVPHPIQDATDDEMRDKADAIIDQLVAALSSPKSGAEERFLLIHHVFE